jgi:hypothetical protein
MRQKNIYRIYTEEKNKKAIAELTAGQFESFTLQPTLGYYRQTPEKSIVIEIIGAHQREIKLLAKRIRAMNGQKSVLILELHAGVQIERS